MVLHGRSNNLWPRQTGADKEHSPGVEPLSTRHIKKYINDSFTGRQSLQLRVMGGKKYFGKCYCRESERMQLRKLRT